MGVTSKYFEISRGLRQGDPLSIYLFILAVETLSENTRKSSNISGIKLKGKEVKILQYADDTSFILKDEIYLKNALQTLSSFDKIPGARINNSKIDRFKLVI